MKYFLIIILIFKLGVVCGDLTIASEQSEDDRIRLITNIIRTNVKTNVWNTVLCIGNLSDAFYNEIRRIPHAFVIADIQENYNIDPNDDTNGFTPHHANTVVISTVDFEKNLLKLVKNPYWHPLANVMLYYHNQTKEVLPNYFFSFWYFNAINAIIVQDDDYRRILSVSVYSPYGHDGYKLDNNYGCYTVKPVRLGTPSGPPAHLTFGKDFTCVDSCQNVTLFSKLRANNIGTCIAYNTIEIPYNTSDVKKFNLFDDKTKNLHGYALRAYTTEVIPFTVIDAHENGTFTIRSRDGILWNTLGKLMNFSIDLSPSKDVIKQPFNFDVSIHQIFSFTKRKGDLYLIPVYLFHFVIIDVDFTFPYRDSGVCIMSHRADFETTLFDMSMLQTHYEFMVQSIICFISVWMVFVIYKRFENGNFTFDQIGKDLMNAFRNVLLTTLQNPPKHSSFRLFLITSIWGFFIISFMTQAEIISFFTAVKRGKEVETFEDVIEKGYMIEGMASPDLILPDTEETFRTINSRLKPVQDLFTCVEQLSNDSRRFCLIDCSVGRHTQLNRLNEHGEQYLHIAKDRMHSRYLSAILPKNSPYTERISKYLMTFFEAGLILKWEQYRYANIKDEAKTKPLAMEDIRGLFDAYCIGAGFTFVIFVLELITYYTKVFMKRACIRKL